MTEHRTIHMAQEVARRITGKLRTVANPAVSCEIRQPIIEGSIQDKAVDAFMAAARQGFIEEVTYTDRPKSGRNYVVKKGRKMYYLLKHEHYTADRETDPDEQDSEGYFIYGYTSPISLEANENKGLAWRTSILTPGYIQDGWKTSRKPIGVSVDALFLDFINAPIDYTETARLFISKRRVVAQNTSDRFTATVRMRQSE